jgi:hypothetical protein
LVRIISGEELEIYDSFEVKGERYYVLRSGTLDWISSVIYKHRGFRDSGDVDVEAVEDFAERSRLIIQIAVYAEMRKDGVE